MCGDYIRSFFSAVLEALVNDNGHRAIRLMSNLHEPNETCLGVSQGRPDGRGVGVDKAEKLISAIKLSQAFQSGLLSDLSEAELFIRDIGPDTISDLTTNILRKPLADYTKQQCDLHGIPTTPVNALPPTWSLETLEWESTELLLPIVEGRPILLVPKFSVRQNLSLNSQEFWNHHLIEFKRMEHLQNNTAGLVKVFKKSKERYVTKKSVKELNPLIKDELAKFVNEHPEVLQAYKDLKGARGALTNHDLDEEFDETLFAQALSERLGRIPTGGANASEYHNVVMGICTFLFYPNLILPVKEREIHNGRKRIDIKYTNSAQNGFFFRVLESVQMRALSVVFECKNYTNDVANPEIDQLQGRFGLTRGFLGFLLLRNIERRDWLVASCRDTALDGRGYVIALDDSAMHAMLNLVSNSNRNRIDAFLQAKLDEIAG